MTVMKVVRKKVRSLCSALLVLILCLALHPAISHSISMQAPGYTSVSEVRLQQPNPASTLSIGPCSTDHIARFPTPVDLSCDGPPVAKTWPLTSDALNARQIFYPPHRPPIKT